MFSSFWPTRFGRGPDGTEKLDERLDIANSRNVTEVDRTARQERGGDDGEGGVLVAGRADGATKRVPAFDNVLDSGHIDATIYGKKELNAAPQVPSATPEDTGGALRTLVFHGLAFPLHQSRPCTPYNTPRSSSFRSLRRFRTRLSTETGHDRAGDIPEDHDRLPAALATVALLVLAVGLVPAAWNFRKTYKKVNELIDRVYGDITPMVRSASVVTEDAREIVASFKGDAQAHSTNGGGGQYAPAQSREADGGADRPLQRDARSRAGRSRICFRFDGVDGTGRAHGFGQILTPTTEKTMATSLVNEQQRQGDRPMRARRGRGSRRNGGSHSTKSSDKELDLLTAALIGLVGGATATLLLGVVLLGVARWLPSFPPRDVEIAMWAECYRHIGRKSRGARGRRRRNTPECGA